jgi:hypothetical protein
MTMNASAVVVATVTWARSDREETALRTSLECLISTGLPIAVADRGTSASFSAFLRSSPGVDVVTPREPGLVPQVKAGVGRALGFGARFVLYTEPDKHWFFQHALMAFIENAPDDDSVGVVMPSRSPDSFQTFPPMQRYTEGVINHLCAQCIGNDGDYSYGPFLIRRMLLPAIADAPDEVGWGWRPFMFRKAHEKGLRLVHAEGDYPCPADQRDEDAAERTHRLRQLGENIRGLIA